MRIFAKIAGLGFLLAASGFAAEQAQADDAANNTTANLNVSLDILQGCSIGFDSGSNGDSGNVFFGKVYNLDSPLTQNIAVNVRCSKGSDITYKVGFNPGQHAEDNNYQKRRMKNDNGESYIGYKICQDSGCSRIWGDKDPDMVKSKDFTPAGNGNYDTHIVYLQVPPQPGIALHEGLYRDQVVATVFLDK